MFWKTLRMRLLAIILVYISGTASACTVPVFRYALDRWEADRFHLVLPSPLTNDAEISDLLRPLRANGVANLDIETSTDSALKEVELHFSTREQTTLWKGTLDEATLGAILASPARKVILERILAGDSVVWVMADGGTPEDDAAAARIEKRLKFLEQVATLPIQDPDDPDSQLGPGPPLFLKFTLLRFRRNDSAERIFAKMLLGPEGLINPETTSFAAAVFGRGRVLGVWALGDLNDVVLEDVSLFLVGRCSCRIKNENPGWDILMNVDWSNELQSFTDMVPEKVSASAQAMPSSVVQTQVAPNISLAPLRSDRKNIALAGGVVALIGLVWFALTIRKKSTPES
jgi:hypothetical protein